MGVVTEIFREVKRIKRDQEKHEGIEFEAKRKRNGRVVISEKHGRYEKIKARSAKKAENKIRKELLFQIEGKKAFDTAASAALLTTVATVSYGAAKRDAGLVYKGLVIGGYVLAESKILGWFFKVEGNRIRMQGTALDKLRYKTSKNTPAK